MVPPYRAFSGAAAVAALLASTSSVALAQQTVRTPAAAEPAAGASPTKEKDNTVAGVVVTAERPAVRSSIDRRSYNVSRDLQGATGSIGDVLRNLPSVDVDLEGNIQLRGDSKVQVLIDGKPSVLMNGSQRALTLQTMQASTVESIEVMTNPSAEFDPNGSAGVINIVTKKTRASGRTGGVVLRTGSEGRASVVLNGTYKADRMTLAGSVSVNAFDKRWDFTQERTSNPAAPQENRIFNSGSTEASRVGWGATGGVDYDLTPRDRLSLNLSHYQNPSTALHSRRYTEEAGAVLVRDYDRVGDDEAPNESTNLSLNYRHAFAEPEREFKINLQRGESEQTNTTLFTNTYREPDVATTRDERTSLLRDVFLTLAADYVLPIEGGAKLRAGYSFNQVGTDSSTSSRAIRPDSGASTPLPEATYDFAYERSIHALYATYQQPLGRWTALAGLRLEHSVVDTDLRTTGLVVSNDDLSLYPSLHLQYDLAEHQKLKLSYSHRVSRPHPAALNAFVFHRDEFNAFAGNPYLQPQDTDAFEAGWEYEKSGRSWLATLYLRRNSNVFSSASRLISPTVLLTTTENLGENTAGGLELAATGRLGSRINYNVSGNVFYNEIESANPLFPETRSAFSHSVKGRLDYRVTAKDLIQVSASYTGERLRNQGYAPAFGSLNLGYQHKFRPNLFAVLTVSDIFRSATSTTVSETPAFREISTQRGTGRTVSLAITRLFGGRPPRDAAFEYVE